MNSRYLGDDEPTNNLNDKSRSQILLQKLHQEAKVRQQQLGIKTGTTNEQKGENKESEGVQDRKGKRKAKEEAGISEEGRKKTKQLARGNKERGRKPKSKQGGDAGLGTENLFQK